MTDAPDSLRTGEPQPLAIPMRRRLLRAFSAPLSALGLGGDWLDEAILLAAASELAGEPVDAPPGLEVLLSALHAEGDLDLIGRRVARTLLVNSLGFRRLAQREAEQHADALQTPPKRPLVIVGLPRTGTTLLHRLLARDDNALYLPTWLTLMPSPLPTEEEWLTRNSPRIARAANLVCIWSLISPGFAGKHKVDAQAPEEEATLLMQTFNTPLFIGAFAVPSYLEWAMQQDREPAYGFLKERLSLYQSTRPGEHWVLKTPFHLPFLDKLLETFPDACIVHTHRDVAKAVPSTIDLFEQGHVGTSRTPRRAETIDAVTRFCRAGVTRAMEVRDRLGEDHFFDVHYDELVRDPEAMVLKIYNRFGLTPAAGFGDRIRSRAREPRGHAPKPYTPEEWGLDGEAVRDAFADYTARFNVAVEG